MEKLVSVIIPIYNTEKYLKKCINSVLSQTFKNLEIILLNDGSTDSSLEICNKFVEVDTRIKLVNLVNGGAARARNIGIDISTGDFLVFIDSDDWIESNFIEVLMRNDLCNDGYLAACGWKKENKHGLIIDQVNNGSKVELTVEQVLSRYGKDPIGFTMIMYPKSLFNISKIRFDEDASIAEDTLFVIMCLLNSKGVIYEPLPLYHIVQSEESITRSQFSMKQLSGIDTYDKIISLLSSSHRDISDNFKIIKIQYITNLIVKLYIEKQRGATFKKIEKDLVVYLGNHLWSFLLNNRVGVKSKLRAIILIYFKMPYVLYQKIKKRRCIYEY